MVDGSLENYITKYLREGNKRMKKHRQDNQHEGMSQKEEFPKPTTKK